MAVYPRVYGGTVASISLCSGVGGLSPRVRGNQEHSHERTDLLRSIPACTGEPWRASPSVPVLGVYPRVYGGTSHRACGPARGRGLSPRVRGNRVLVLVDHEAEGSIPACTGEPGGWPCRHFGRWVYPRVYGGTIIPLSTSRCSSGLSPRVRGNRISPVMSGRFHGSIPACTGEPIAALTRPCAISVYPRVYGGTRRPPPHHPLRPGLSPRVRGNLILDLIVAPQQRSIPACTGEPAAHRSQG